MTRAVKLSPSEWAGLSEKAHVVVFGEKKPAEWDRIDYALVSDNDGQLRCYITCRETHHDTVYWQHGGAFPGTKGTPLSVQDMRLALDWTKERYKRVTFWVENTNQAMLKMAMKFGFLIVGIRNFQGSVLLEHLLEFEGSN